MKKKIITASLLVISYLGFGQTTWNITGNSNTTASNFIGTTTGVNQPLIVRTNGAEAIRALGSNQFVGIGNANPLHRLSVAGNIAFNQNLVSRTQNATINWGVGGPGYLSFRVLTGAENVLGNYIERMVIDQAGNVGIATTSGPTEKLHVNGTLRVDGTDGTGGIRVFKDGNAGITSHLYLGNVANNRAFNFQLNADGSVMTLWNYQGSAWSKKFEFSSNGSFGIGTNGPQAYLHVVTPASAGHGLLVEHNDPNPGYGEEIRVKNNGTNAFVIANTIAAYKEVFKVFGDGRTVIGNPLAPSSPHATNFLLSVKGKAVFQEVIVTNLNWADFVFDSNYKLPKLSEVEAYYKANKHLPEIPSANEVEKSGISVGEMNKLLLQKIEELTIYVVEQQKEIESLKSHLIKK